MIDYQKVVRNLCVALLMFSGGWTAVHGQQDSSFSGRIQVGNYLGDADFRYRLVNKDTVLSGPFNMRGSNLDQLSASELEYFSFEGNFEENLPEDEWRIEFGEYYATGGAKLVDYHFQMKVGGTQNVAEGKLSGGKPEGKWKHSTFHIDNSETVEKVFESVISFDEGIPRGTFQIEGDELKLLGLFGKDGFAEDEWALNFEKIPGTMEYWHFVEGRLATIVIQRTQKSDTLSIYPEDFENFKVVNLGPHYFEILKLQHILTNKTFVKFEGGMSKLLTRNTELYERVDSLFYNLSDRHFMPVFKVKVEHFPISEEELIKLDSIENRLDKVYREMDDLRQNTQVNILKHGDRDMAFLLATLNAIEEEWTSPLSKIVGYHSDSLLEFLPRENLLQVLMASKPDAELEVEVDFNDSTEVQEFEGPNSKRMDWEAKGLNAVDQLSQYAVASVDSIAGRLNEKLQQQEREQELVELEDNLMQELADFEQFIDSLKGEVSGELDEIIGSLKRTANKELSKYSGIAKMTSKPERAKALIACLDEMKQLALTLAKLPERDETIEQEYTDEVWNPFTSTTMTEKIKKRIFKAYEEVLKPHYFEQIKNNLSCSNAEDWKDRLDTTHERMLALTGENTSRIERKLKNEEEPKVVMELLRISIN